MTLIPTTPHHAIFSWSPHCLCSPHITRRVFDAPPNLTYPKIMISHNRTWTQPTPPRRREQDHIPVPISIYNQHHHDGNKIPLPLSIYIILFPSSWWSLYREGWTGKYLVFVVVVVMVVRVGTVFVVVVMHTRVIGKYSRCGGSLQDVDHGNMSG